MALTLVRAWRGVVRATLRDANGGLQSLINYDNKHPTYGLFTPTEHAEIVAVQTLIQAKLAATRLR